MTIDLEIDHIEARKTKEKTFIHDQNLFSND
jgi:hypothetical protein